MEYEKDREMRDWHIRVLSRDWFPNLEDYIESAIENRVEPEKLFLYVGDKNYEIFKSVRESKIEERRQQEFTYFWETTSPFSQWYKKPFFGPTCLNRRGIIKNEDKVKFILRGHFPEEGKNIAQPNSS